MSAKRFLSSFITNHLSKRKIRLPETDLRKREGNDKRVRRVTKWAEAKKGRKCEWDFSKMVWCSFERELHWKKFFYLILMIFNMKLFDEVKPKSRERLLTLQQWCHNRFLKIRFSMMLVAFKNSYPKKDCDNFISLHLQKA